ncbi:MAG TPA: hypothetical protein VGO62_03750 [Myxococcota bacterium]|jgi:hypothetical protein
MTSTSISAAARTTSLTCTGCGAVVAIEDGQRTAVCIYCMTPGVLEKPRAAGAEPAFVMPFIVGNDNAKKSVALWQRSRSIFARSSIKTAKVESMRGVYVPAYLYSCVATTSYSAEIGEEYQEEEEYTTTEDGKRVTRTRMVTRTEWHSLSGTHAKYVTDVVVTASKGVPNAELERIEPFELRQLRRMDESVLPGFFAEDPSLASGECMEMARKEAVDDVGQALASFMPGDTHRGLTWKTWFEREGLDLVLVPLWVLAVRYDAGKPALRVLVNGQTGKAGGDAPLSPVKITIAVLLGLAVVGAGVALYFIGRSRRWW